MDLVETIITLTIMAVISGFTISGFLNDLKWEIKMHDEEEEDK